jgi:predicted PurR-regulated permease PerM
MKAVLPNLSTRGNAMPPLLLAGTALALAWVLLPFYGAILWALVIAMLFVPVYRALLAPCRQHRNLAAALVMLLVLLVVVLPFAWLTASLASEASVAYERIQAGEWNPGLYLRGLFDALPAWVIQGLQRAGVADFDTLQRQLTTALAQGSRFLATQAFSIGLDTFGFVASLCVTLYLAYFLIRDGEAWSQLTEAALPVPASHKRALVERFVAVVRATVTGGLLVAGVQGALGGFALWFLGVQGAVLWAVLMALLSLLPMIGAALVWLPIAVYFLIVGAVWQGLALVAYGVLVIGLIDNLLRPLLVGKNAHLPDCIVMITTLGGVAIFGINGFILGPTIAAMFIAVWQTDLAAATGAAQRQPDQEPEPAAAPQR